MTRASHGCIEASMRSAVARVLVVVGTVALAGTAAADEARAPPSWWVGGGAGVLIETKTTCFAAQDEVGCSNLVYRQLRVGPAYRPERWLELSLEGSLGWSGESEAADHRSASVVVGGALRGPVGVVDLHAGPFAGLLLLTDTATSGADPASETQRATWAGAGAGIELRLGSRALLGLRQRYGWAWFADQADQPYARDHGSTTFSLTELTLAIGIAD